jgi:putative aldouronate transport system substrate-binding protein
MIFGPPPSTFSIIKQNQITRNYVVSEFRGRLSDGLAERSTILSQDFKVAMDRVIMGEDISLFDRAVADWRRMGGDEIIQEVNEWWAVTR